MRAFWKKAFATGSSSGYGCVVEGVMNTIDQIDDEIYQLQLEVEVFREQGRSTRVQDMRIRELEDLASHLYAEGLWQ